MLICTFPLRTSTWIGGSPCKSDDCSVAGFQAPFAGASCTVGAGQSSQSASISILTSSRSFSTSRNRSACARCARWSASWSISGQQVQRHPEPDHRLFADLHPAPDRRVRVAVRAGGVDQIGAAGQQSRVLRTADALAAAVDHQVGAAPYPAPQVVERRDRRCGVDDHRHAAGVGDLDDDVEVERTRSRCCGNRRRSRGGPRR